VARFEAGPTLLGYGGERAGALAGRLAELRGELAAAGSGSGAAGHPATRAAIEEASRALAQAIEALEQHACGLGVNLHGAGGAYAQTDESAMAGGPAGGT